MFHAVFLYSFVVYLYVSRSGSITSVGGERANLSAVVSCNYVVLFGEVSSSSGCLAWATFLLWHSLSLPYNY